MLERHRRQVFVVQLLADFVETSLQIVKQRLHGSLDVAGLWERGGGERGPPW